MRVRLKDDHPIDVVHRVSAAVLGVGLAVFAAGGLASGAPFLATRGVNVLGLFANGALAVLSVVAAMVLLASAVWGGRIASTVTTGMGGIFLLSGLVHLGLLNTSANVFAFRLPNVFFSLVAGMLLAFVGLYGRLSGGLPPDNPYRRANPRRSDRPEPQEQLAADQNAVGEGERTLLDAELAMGEGKADLQQQRMVYADLARRRSAERARAYRNAPATQQPRGKINGRQKSR